MMNPNITTATGKRSYHGPQHQQQISRSLAAAGWEWYKGVVRHHRLTLDLLDDALSRILFWLPHHGDEIVGSDGGRPNEESRLAGMEGDAAWREVGYGILSLHRLVQQLALDDDDDDDNVRMRRNHYGTSVRTQNPPTVAATSLRIGLTVLHSVLPSLLALATLRATTRQTGHRRPNAVAAAASKVRLILEQAKFFLRVSLLVPYWRQLHQQQQAQPDTVGCGILLDGGLYHASVPQESLGLPWEQARAIQRRKNYVGERTGWKSRGNNDTLQSDTANTNGLYQIISSLMGQNAAVQNQSPHTTTVVAELLYAVRPLLWAWFEHRYHRAEASISRGRNPSAQLWKSNPTYSRSSLWRGWLVCLFLDLLSIRMLERRLRPPSHSRTVDTTNPFTSAELKRRKLRLGLYVLRSPVWSTHTLPALEGLSRVLSRIPVLGSLVDTVVWDWILYYRHPFVAEEG